ncbi:MAG: HAMP domain-containing protein, partial [Deltaproteobacteria bacterium]|nr:HAMP domain-containing protein [Deltaproteobacteria bacterium]
MNGKDKGRVTGILTTIFWPGLIRTLIVWFMLIALAPLAVVSTISYLQAKDSLRNAIIEAQQTTIALKSAFIDNWFSYRFLDLETQSTSLENTRFLEELRKALQAGGKEVGDFVGSDRWTSIVDEHSGYLMALKRTYGYHDLFLVDSDGNILFTAIGEPDLGTNLFNGPYSGTLFARTCKQSLESGRQIFSDLEFYAPSNNAIAGFLAAPIVDKSGERIGIFAFQVPIDKIDRIMQDTSGMGKTGETYLVGPDLTLRSDSAIYEEEKILSTRVDTEQTRKWHREHIAGNRGREKEVAFIYRGHHGKNVLGFHTTVNVAGVKWGLIAEIEEAEAFASVTRLRTIVMILGITTGFVVLIVAFVLSWRIVNPLLTLTAVAEQIQAGGKDVRAVVPSGNEIEILAKTFNSMLDSLNKALADTEQARDKIDGILRSVADGLIVTDIYNNVVLMNKAAE